MSFIDSLTKMVGTVSGLLAGPIVPAVLAIANDLIELIDNAKDVIHSDDQEALQALRDQLEPLVLAHADATEAKLRGQV
jgi:hypothetical protein